MEWLTAIFSLICGQGHCFAAGGEPLPVCQRCLGLYLGAALTAGWLLAAGGLWRRGLPSWSVFLAQEVALLAAMLGGVHVWGDSPAARAICGLWTGHVATVWLAGAAGHLRWLSRPSPPPQPPWRLGDKLSALAALGLLAGLGAVLPHAMALGWWTWTLAALAGAAALAAAIVAAVVTMATWALRRPLTRPNGPPTHMAAGPS